MTLHVTLSDYVYDKIMHFVNRSDYEVSGLGKIIRVGDEIKVIDAILLPQENTKATTDIEPEDVGRAMYLLKDQPGELKFWWHSHVNMGVFWSQIDRDTMDALAHGGWFVSTVFNKKCEMKTAITMNDPIPLLLDNVTTYVDRPVNQEMIKQWDEEYDKNVTNVVWVPQKSAGAINEETGQIAVFSPKCETKKGKKKKEVEPDYDRLWDNWDKLTEEDWAVLEARAQRMSELSDDDGPNLSREEDTYEQEIIEDMLIERANRKVVAASAPDYAGYDGGVW